MKKDKSLKEWDNSIEGILYSMNTIGSITLEDKWNDTHIAQVLLKVPKEIKEMVLEEDAFVHTTAHGTVRRLHFQKFIEEKDKKRLKGDGLIESGFMVAIPKVFRDVRSLSGYELKIVHTILVGLSLAMPVANPACALIKGEAP